MVSLGLVGFVSLGLVGLDWVSLVSQRLVRLGFVCLCFM